MPSDLGPRVERLCGGICAPTAKVLEGWHIAIELEGRLHMWVWDLFYGRTAEGTQTERKAYDVCLDTRKLEIQLFWQRSVFFWGFIGAAFVGLAALWRTSDFLCLAIASFGLVCSYAWVRVNQGSKYWQENWETKVERLEESTGQRLFGQQEDVIHALFGARRYSVSKLTIALSLYTLVTWFAITIYLVSKALFGPAFLTRYNKPFSLALPVLSLLFIAAMTLACKTRLKR